MSRKSKKSAEKVEAAQAENVTPEDAPREAETCPADADELPVVEGEAQEGPSPLEILRNECDDLKEKWLRAVAEMDNVRKRSRREVADSRRFAQAEVLRAFLEVQDNFERALQSMNGGDDTAAGKGLRDGVELIFQNYRRILKDQGVLAIEALDQEFDPAVHEAVGQFEREGVEPGKVIEIVQQGFRLGDMVLRPTRVIISA